MEHQPTLRVVVQDRRRLFRDAVATALGMEADLEVVATAATGTWSGNGPSGLPACAYRAGIRSVFTRSAGVAQLLSVVRSAAQEPGPRPATAGSTLVRLAERRRLLTSREVAVLGAINAGATTRTVAAAMGISTQSVENHRQRIFAKLGVQHQAHTVSLAMRPRLLKPSGFPPSAA